MRNIKFRAQRLDNREWAYGYLFQGKTDEKTKHAFILKDDLYVDGGYIPDGNVLFTRNEISVVDIDTIGQFTGISDKDGKEIYEGDIIQREGLKRVGQVYFTNGCFYAVFEGFAMPMHQLIAEYDIRVVGHAYVKVEARIVETALGKMRIENDTATDITDEKCFYSLPFKDMTDEEIIRHFEILYENNQ